MDENRTDLFGELIPKTENKNAEPLPTPAAAETESNPTFAEQAEKTVAAVIAEQLAAEPTLGSEPKETPAVDAPDGTATPIAPQTEKTETVTESAQTVQQKVNAFYNQATAADNGCTYSYGRAQQPVNAQNINSAQSSAEPAAPTYNRPPMYAQPPRPQYAGNSANFSQNPSYNASQQNAHSAANAPAKTDKKDQKKEKKAKKQKSRMSVGQFLVCIVLCLVVSSAAGYFSSKNAVKDLLDEYMATMETAGTTGSYNINIYEQPTATTVPPATQPSTEAATVPVVNNASASDIYKQNVNAVVNITAKGYRTVNYGFFFGSQQQEFTSSGSGFFLTEDGYILTNYHVVEDTTSITVTDYDGKEHTARLVGFEESNDIAVLKVSGTFQAVDLGDSTTLEVGDTLLIIGNALGELQYTLTQGVVSYLERAVTTETGTVINMFQTDAAINSGNSGGPVFNAKGEVVGIASAKYASSSIEGLGFCIPIDDVKYMISDIVNVGYVTGKPSVGVSLYTNSSRTNGLPYGCYIVAVEYGSAADAEGLSEGDVITAVEGKTVRDVDDFGAALNGKKAGDSLTMTVYFASSGYSSDVTITLDEYVPADARTEYSNVYDF